MEYVGEGLTRICKYKTMLIWGKSFGIGLFCSGARFPSFWFACLFMTVDWWVWELWVRMLAEGRGHLHSDGIEICHWSFEVFCKLFMSWVFMFCRMLQQTRRLSAEFGATAFEISSCSQKASVRLFCFCVRIQLPHSPMRKLFPPCWITKLFTLHLDLCFSLDDLYSSVSFQSCHFQNPEHWHLSPATIVVMERKSPKCFLYVSQTPCTTTHQDLQDRLGGNVRSKIYNQLSAAGLHDCAFAEFAKHPWK